MNRKREVNINNHNKLLYDPNQRKLERLGAFSMQENLESDDLDSTEENDELEQDLEENLENEDNAVSNENNLANDSNFQKNVNNSSKEVAKQATKEVTKQASKAVGTATKKVIGQVASKIGAFLIANPWVLLIIGIVIVFLIIIMAFVSSSDDSNSPMYSDVCSEIAIGTTSLSQNEFVEKVQTYFADSDSKARKTFSENAAKIYQIATNNGVNPELVVIRAILEGFSPGVSKNNYWGLGCTNTGGYDACISYDSFDDGVLGYVNNISKYESVDDMMSKYAYIGSYWYNPGGSATGGCHYFEYIKEYMSTSRAAEVEKICSSDKVCTTSGGDNCVATTEEDQLAYAKYQVSKMSEVRKNVFGIDPDNCAEYSSDCIIFAQNDPRWKTIPLGKSSTNVGESGCAVTSIAIAITCSGTPLTVDNFNPGVFVNTLNNNSCFTDSGNIYWGCSAIKSIAPAVNYVDSYKFANATLTKEFIESQNPNNTFMIIHFENSEHPRGHYVVYSSTEGNYFVTKDPAGGGKISKVLISEIDQVLLYTY